MSNGIGRNDAEDDAWIEEFMLPYAMWGWSMWSKADETMRTRSFECLEGHIAVSDWEVRQAVRSPYSLEKGEDFVLIPLPGTRDEVEQAFFLPLADAVRSQSRKISLELFLIVKQKDCLALRWELAENPPTTHGYAHVQMCKHLAKRTLRPTSIPDWIPDSYPAVPLLASDSFGMFLCMITAMHGLEEDGGVKWIVYDLLKGEPGLRNRYIERIDQHFAYTVGPL